MDCYTHSNPKTKKTLNWVKLKTIEIGGQGDGGVWSKSIMNAKEFKWTMRFLWEIESKIGSFKDQRLELDPKLDFQGFSDSQLAGESWASSKLLEIQRSARFSSVGDPQKRRPNCQLTDFPLKKTINFPIWANFLQFWANLEEIWISLSKILSIFCHLDPFLKILREISKILRQSEPLLIFLLKFRTNFKDFLSF